LQTADEFHGRQTAPKPALDEGWIMKMFRRDVLAAGTTTAMMAIANSVPAVGAQSRAGGAIQTFDVIIIIVRGGSAGAVFGKKQCVGHMRSTCSSAQGLDSRCRFHLGSRDADAEMRDEEGTYGTDHHTIGTECVTTRGQTEVSHLQPTFGRYAEIPYDQMTREQQEGYRSLVKAEGREPGSQLSGPLKRWVNNPQLSTAVASVTWQHSTPFAKSA
jgi:hypothetical protein